MRREFMPRLPRRAGIVLHCHMVSHADASILGLFVVEQ